jgi:hypothetical protein
MVSGTIKKSILVVSTTGVVLVVLELLWGYPQFLRKSPPIVEITPPGVGGCVQDGMLSTGKVW